MSKLFAVFLVPLVHASNLAIQEVQHHTRHQALVGFEQYARELSSRVLQAPEHNTNLTETETAAIETIKAFISTMFGNMNQENDVDKTLIELCRSGQDECVKLYNNTNKQQLGHVNFERQHHVNEREEELQDYCKANMYCDGHEKSDILPSAGAARTCKSEGITNVEGYHPLREDSGEGRGKPPSCFNDDDDQYSENSHLSDIMMDKDYFQDEADVTTMEKCLNATKPWLELLSRRKINCRKHEEQWLKQHLHAAAIQRNFEEVLCLYGGLHSQTCKNYDVCWDDSIKSCEKTCDNIAVAVEARKADNETALRIVCLLDVLLSDNPDKPDALMICQNKTYDTSYWDLSCSWSETKPPLYPECTDKVTMAKDYPCHPEWLNRTYTSQSWYPFVSWNFSCQLPCDLSD